MADQTPQQLDLNKVGDQMKTLLQTAAKSYVEGHTADLTALGDDFGPELLQAIFHTSVLSQLPEVTPPDPADPNVTMDQLVTIATALEARNEQLLLVSAAEKKDADTVKKLKDDAVGAAGAIANSLFGLFSGVVKAAMGGL